MIVKYNRTSTMNQEGLRFNQDKDTYGMTLFDRGVSGKIPFIKRPNGFKLMELCRTRKVKKVVFQDLSRVGRTLLDTRQTLDTIIKEYGVKVEVINQKLSSHNTDGTLSSTWTLISSVLLSIYEMERDRILELTSSGRKQYVEMGGVLGRPKDSKENGKSFMMKPTSKRILSLLRKGKSNTDIISRLSVSPKTITKVRRIGKEKGVLG
jgi:DNA invertase Pin-like site-specific DNA recombinase